MYKARAKELVDQFSGHKVLVVGDACVDRYIFGVVERLNPEAPVPILHAKKERVSTGCAGNVAKNLAALGAQAVLVSVVGEDDAAGMLATQAEVEGYTTFLKYDTSRPTIRKIRYLVANQQLLRVDYEELHELATEIERQVLEEIRRQIDDGITAIIVSDYAKGFFTPTLSQELVRISKEKKIMLAVDAKPPRAQLFVGASLMTPNLKEAHEFLGLSYFSDRRSGGEVAQKIHEKFQTDAYVTMSSEGMAVHAAKHEPLQVPQEHVAEVFDVSGAGDTAIVTITLALLSGASPEEAAVLGNAAGAVVVGKIGSVGVTPEELLDMVSHRHE